MTTTDNVDRPHACPGGCERLVPFNRLACLDCWPLLPVDQRTAITRARGRHRRELVGEAIGWYRTHVARGRLINEPPKNVRYTLDESWRPRGA